MANGENKREAVRQEALMSQMPICAVFIDETIQNGNLVFSCPEFFVFGGSTIWKDGKEV